MSSQMTILALAFVSLATITAGLSNEPGLANLAGTFSIQGLPIESFDSKVDWISRPDPDSLNAHVLRRQNNGDDPQPTRHGPIVTLAQAKNCVSCPKPELLELNGKQLLAHLKTRQMKAYMRGDASQLHNKCVFYTRPEERVGGPQRLSGRATQWACRYNKFSIWHLWPNALMARSESSRYKDFYGIYEEGNWLNKIQKMNRYPRPPQPEIVYFENMSEAMAQSCTGEVVIMTEDPENIKKFSERPNQLWDNAGNIWGNKELPALRNSFNAGRAGPFYVVDIKTWSTGSEKFPVYELDIKTQKVAPSEKSFDPVSQFTNNEGSLNATNIDGNAQACRSDGVESEIEGRDYFAGTYPQS